MKILIDQNEFDFEHHEVDQGSQLNLTAETSVNKLKAHFFSTLAEIGEIRRFSRNDANAKGELARALASPDAFVACFHELPPNLPCRMLQHTKGGLMLPGGFLDGWTLGKSTVSIVTSQIQAKRLQGAFRQIGFEPAPFYPCIDDIYRNSKRERPEENHFCPEYSSNLVYAGRWIANKGITQAVRALNLWPFRTLNLKLIGGFEHGFPIDQAGGTHSNFPHFFHREILARNQVLKISTEAALPPHMLAEKFKNCSVFLYPSFHEDENYGLATREAALCGAIPLVTDICGLGELGRKASGALLKTWPTFGGIRYSLRKLSEEVRKILSWSDAKRKLNSDANRKIVEDECSPAITRVQLEDAIRILLKKPICSPPEGGWRCSNSLQKLVEDGPGSFREALSHSSDSDPEGLYVEGIGYRNKDYSEARFLTAIQGLYTTYPTTPKPLKGSRLHGFWRVGLWKEERALVEFGFPGPRFLRFEPTDWDAVAESAEQLPNGETSFRLRNTESCRALQKAVDLGYLVPDDLETCHFENPPN